MPGKSFWGRITGDPSSDSLSPSTRRQSRRLTKPLTSSSSRNQSTTRLSSFSLPFTPGGYPETEYSGTQPSLAIDTTPSPSRLSDSATPSTPSFYDCYSTGLHPASYDAPPEPTREPPPKPEALHRSQSEFSLASRRFSFPLRGLRTSPSGQSLGDETRRSFVSSQEEFVRPTPDTVRGLSSTTTSRKRRSLVDPGSAPARHRSLLNPRSSSKRISNKLLRKQQNMRVPSPNEDQLYYFDSKTNQFRPIEEKPGFKSYPNTYYPHRAGTPCELSVESSGGLRLGALRVMNASPVPSERTSHVDEDEGLTPEGLTPNSEMSHSSCEPIRFEDGLVTPTVPEDAVPVIQSFQTIPWEYSEPVTSIHHVRGPSNDTIYYDAEEASVYTADEDRQSEAFLQRYAASAEDQEEMIRSLLSPELKSGNDFNYEYITTPDAATLAGNYAHELAESILESRGVTPLPLFQQHSSNTVVGQVQSATPPPARSISRPRPKGPALSISRKPVAPDSGYNSHTSLLSLSRANGLQRGNSKDSGVSDLSSRPSRSSPQSAVGPVTPQSISPLSMHPIIPDPTPATEELPLAPPAPLWVHTRAISSSSSSTTKALPQLPKELPSVPITADEPALIASRVPERRRSRSRTMFRLRSRSRSRSRDSPSDIEPSERVPVHMREKNKPPSASDGTRLGLRRRSRSRSISELQAAPVVQIAQTITNGHYPPDVPEIITKRLSQRASSPMPRLAGASRAEDRDTTLGIGDGDQDLMSSSPSDQVQSTLDSSSMGTPGTTTPNRTEFNTIAAPHQVWSHPILNQHDRVKATPPTSGRRRISERSRQNSLVQFPPDAAPDIDYINEQLFSDNPGGSPYDHGMRAQRSMSAERTRRSGDQSGLRRRSQYHELPKSRHPPSSSRPELSELSPLEGQQTRSDGTSVQPRLDLDGHESKVANHPSHPILMPRSHSVERALQGNSTPRTCGAGDYNRPRPLSMFTAPHHLEEYDPLPELDDSAFYARDRVLPSRYRRTSPSVPLPATRAGLAQALGVSHRASYCLSPASIDSPVLSKSPTEPARPAPPMPSSTEDSPG